MYQQQSPTAAYTTPSYAAAPSTSAAGPGVYPATYSNPTAAAGTAAAGGGGQMSGPIPYIPYNPNAGLRGPGYPEATGVAYPGLSLGMPGGAGGMMAGTTPQTPHGAPTPPAEPDVTPSIADAAVRKLVSAELKSVGFEKGEPTAVRRLEYEVQAFVQQLYQRAHEYANLSNRAGAIASDVLKACEEFDMPINELHSVAKSNRRKRRKIGEHNLNTTLLPPKSRSVSPELLPSDDSDNDMEDPSGGYQAPKASLVPTTLRTLPSYLPTLPPKHTYMKTPASPPKKAALPSLEKKLKTAGLVQKSLQNLLTATEDGGNLEDAELLGHIVNWETGLHPRKRWRVRK
ncbi:hypothetical protein BKA70DRAFT_576059 [Coprinopsis sp. MPI-PUGE-AT-0042]|nr:hypothetical protein BKA70DRAFT_576059 [Coprinopsis sp. MPI-PUGE-AT-0042]